MFKFKSLARGLAIAFTSLTCVAATASAAHADLADILQSGVLKIGTTMDNPPFAYYDESGNPAGLDIELGNLVAQAMGVKAELVPMVMANRMPLLLADKADVLIASFGLVPDRALQVMYSQPYANNTEAVWGPKEIAIAGPDDLGDHSIGVGTGTIQDKALTAVAPNANITRFDSDALTVTAFLTGQTELIAIPVTLATIINHDHPDKAIEKKFDLQGTATAHIGVRQGEFQLLQFINTYLYYLRTNGTLDALFEKHMGVKPNPLPWF